MTGEQVVVFGDDGSPGADEAWAWLAQQTWPGWTVHVLTAEESVTGFAESASTGPQEWVSPTPRTLDRATGVTQVQHLRAIGDPRVVLSDVADAGFLVIGPRGKGLLKSLHIGSTAEWLTHGPPVPLVLARRPAPVKHVLACVDGSRHADAALSALAQMPWLPTCEVTVLCVASGDLYDPQEVADRGRAGLAPRARQVHTKALSYRPLPPFAGVHSTILAEIEDHGVDLVVLGTRGLSTLPRLRLGSTASAVARLAPCSVLLAHVPDGER